MAELSKENLKTKVKERFNDNTIGQITPARARDMFNDIIDSFVVSSPIPDHYVGEWNTTDALPTVGVSGRNIIKFDFWIVPAGGWNYGEFSAGKWTILMFLGTDITDFEDYKTY